MPNTWKLANSILLYPPTFWGSPSTKTLTVTENQQTYNVKRPQRGTEDLVEPFVDAEELEDQSSSNTTKEDFSLFEGTIEDKPSSLKPYQGTNFLWNSSKGCPKLWESLDCPTFEPRRCPTWIPVSYRRVRQNPSRRQAQGWQNDWRPQVVEGDWETVKWD